MAELVKRELIDGCKLSKFEFKHCIFGKHKRVKFNASVHTTRRILDYVHADVGGHPVELLMVVLITCLLSLMVTQEKCGHIFRNINMMFLMLLRSGKLW